MSGPIHVVRHGQTTLNAEGRFRGRLDPPLDEKGLAEAAAAARWLKDVVAVYSSPLLRSRETAQAIADTAGATVVDDKDLIDLAYGQWQGLTPEEAAARDPELFDRFLHSPFEAETPDGERLAAVLDRLMAAVRRMGQEHPGEAVAAVSHEVPIRLLVAELRGLRAGRMWDLHLPTGSVTTLPVEGEALRIAAPRRLRPSRSTGKR